MGRGGGSVAVTEVFWWLSRAKAVTAPNPPSRRNRQLAVGVRRAPFAKIGEHDSGGLLGGAYRCRIIDIGAVEQLGDVREVASGLGRATGGTREIARAADAEDRAAERRQRRRQHAENRHHRMGEF